MPKSVSLLDRACSDLRAAKILLGAFADEADLDTAAYHVQQCVEKCAKYIANQRGLEYSYQHKLSVFFHDVKMPDIKAIIGDNISLLDEWENKTRYAKYTLSEKREIDSLIGVCERLVSIAQNETPKSVSIADCVKSPLRCGAHFLRFLRNLVVGAQIHHFFDKMSVLLSKNLP